MKKISKVLLAYIVLLLVCVLTGYLLLAGSYTIPVKWLERQVAESADVLSHENPYPLLNQYHQSRLDNYSDTLMLGKAAYATGNVFADAVMTSRYHLPDTGPFEAFLGIWAVEDAPDYTDAYENHLPRYWNGYLILLKPLLIVFNIRQIRWINMGMLVALLCAVLVLMYKRRDTRFCILPLLLSVLCMFPETVGKSMFYSASVYPTLVVMLIILLQQKKRTLYWYSLLFVVTGAVTVYLDLLTYPTISLMFPLCILMALMHEAPLKKRTGYVVGCCAAWGFGYAGMWCSKWIIGCIAYGPSFFPTHVSASISYRMSAADGAVKFSRFGTILMRLKDCFVQPVIPILFVVMLVACVSWTAYRGVKMGGLNWSALVPYLILLCIPFVWTFVMCNFCAIHTFSYRTFAAVLLLLPVLVLSVGKKASRFETEPR